MKIFSLLLIFQAFNLFAAGSPSPVPDRCESNTFCTNGKMPLFNQADWRLISYLQQNVSGSITRDLGFCAPTAGAMFFAGLKLEAPKTKFNNLFDTITDSNVQSKSPELIYNIGQWIHTKWTKGGTGTVDIDYYSNKIGKGISNYKMKETELSVTHLMAGAKAGHFKDEIKKRKMMYLIQLGHYKGTYHRFDSINCSKNPCEINYRSGGAYTRKGGHVLVINGYEGDYYKLYDPWGRIYNIRIDRKFILFGYRAFVWSITGAYGFVQTYGMNRNESSVAVMLDAFYGVGLQD